MAYLASRLPVRTDDRRWRTQLLCNGNTTRYQQYGEPGGCGVTWLVTSDDLWWMDDAPVHYETCRLGFCCQVCGVVTVHLTEDLRIPYAIRRTISSTPTPPPPIRRPAVDAPPPSVWDRINEEP